MRGRQPGGARDLRTVLFTDIVGSTEHATRVGDRAWGDLLARHHALVRAALRATGGREMDTAGDGFFATFARPTDALACAAAIVRGMGPLGLAVRVGLHAGEVETRDGKAAGITVHTAARLMAAAAPDEILASATVRDLAAGAGWTFADRGSLALKGLAEPVHAYALDLAAAPTALPLGQVGVGATLRGVTPPRAIGAAAVVVGLVVVLLAAIALSGGGGAHPSPTATAVAAATTPAATTAPPSPSATDADQLPIPGANEGEAPIPLGPGTYFDTFLPDTPTLTVVDTGWTAAGSLLDTLILSRATSPTDKLTIRWLRTLSNDPCADKPEASFSTDPAGQFGAWAHAEKGLKVTSGTPRQFGDLSATEYDVTVVDKYACQTTDPLSVAITGYVEGVSDTVSLAAGEQIRLEAAPHGGRLLVIVIEARSAAEFQTLEPLAETLLSTLKFTP